MTDAPFTLDDARRRLAEALGRAPKEAVRGEWSGTAMQAGVSKLSGGYRDAGGHHVEEHAGARAAIREVIDKLASGAAEPFNAAEIRWTRSRLPWRRGEVEIETSFVEEIVPRGPDHPVYEEAAAARRRFWETLGEVAAEPAVDRSVANDYAQTKWFGPHRRVLFVRRPGEVLLATDGLSTPWAGISEHENGVECEVMLRLADEGGALTPASPQVETWANLLVELGDLVADGFRVRRDIERHGALLFCRLPASSAPFARMILSVAQGDDVIEGLPFGSIRLLEATPVTKEEILGGDPDEPWAASAARTALEKRRGARAAF